MYAVIIEVIMFMSHDSGPVEGVYIKHSTIPHVGKLDTLPPSCYTLADAQSANINL